MKIVAAVLLMASAFVISTVPTLAQTPPKPGSPAANFRDNELLAQAKVDVMHMYRHELDLLTDALATCRVTGLAEDEAEFRLCRIAFERYDVAYNNGRPINRILYASTTFIELIRLAGEPPAGDPRRVAIGNDIVRNHEVFEELSKAISSRNRELTIP